MFEKIKRQVVIKCYKILKPYIEKEFLSNEQLNKNLSIGANSYIDNSVVFRTYNNDKIIIGNNTSINYGVCIMTYGGTIEIGEFCDINPYTIIYGHGGTKIGNRVLIAGHCMIIPNNHNFADKNVPIINQGNTSKGIVIEDDVWIGHACSILDGVTIGKGSIIGAGSVVTTSIPEYSICTGIPGKVIRKR